MVANVQFFPSQYWWFGGEPFGLAHVVASNKGKSIEFFEFDGVWELHIDKDDVYVNGDDPPLPTAGMDTDDMLDYRDEENEGRSASCHWSEWR